MANIQLGLNLGFVRHDDKPFAWGVVKAAELGYQFVEPVVHWGREVLSDAGEFHSVSLLDDPYRLRRTCERAGVGISALSARAPLCKPEVSTEFLKQAIRFAAECGAPVVNTDEGPKPPFTTEEEDHLLIRYVLRQAAQMAEPRGVVIGLQMRDQYTRTIAGLDRILRLVDSPAIGVNFDTGNSRLGGEDPAGWLAHVQDRLVHLHARDVSARQPHARGGRLAPTLVGCACGEGGIDWDAILRICRALPRDIVFSVQCGAIDEAARSIEYLKDHLQQFEDEPCTGSANSFSE